MRITFDFISEVQKFEIQNNSVFAISAAVICALDRTFVDFQLSCFLKRIRFPNLDHRFLWNLGFNFFSAFQLFHSIFAFFAYTPLVTFTLPPHSTLHSPLLQPQWFFSCFSTCESRSTAAHQVTILSISICRTNLYNDNFDSYAVADA